MTFDSKIKMSTGVPLLVFLLFSVIFYFQVRWMGKSIKQVTEVEAPKCRAATEMETELVGMSFGLFGYLNNPDMEGAEWIEKYRKGFREYQILYCELAENKRGELWAVAIDKNSAALRKIAEEVVNLNNLQMRRLTLLRENLEETDEISDKGFNTCVDSEQLRTFNDLRPFMVMRIWEDDIEEGINCYVMTQDPECEKKLYKCQENFGRFLKTYNKSGDVLSETTWLAQLNGLYADIDRQIRDIIALDKEKQVRIEEFKGKRDRLRTILTSEVEQSHANFEEASSKSHSAVAVSTTVTMFLVFFGIIAAFVTHQYMNFTVSQPVTKLLDAAEKISQGQYDTKVEVVSDGELGQLAESIKKMAEKLKNTSASSNVLNEQIPETEKAGAAN